MNQQDVNVINAYFKNREALSMLGRQAKKIQEASSVVINQIKNNTEASDADVANVKMVINEIIENEVHKPISGDFARFVVSFINILDEWNSKIGKDNDITRVSNYARRLISMHITMVEAIDIMKRVNINMQRTANAGLYPVQLNQEYLKILDEMSSPEEEQNEQQETN